MLNGRVAARRRHACGPYPARNRAGRYRAVRSSTGENPDGLPASEAAALRPVDVVAPEDRGRYLAAARRLVAGHPVRDFEARLFTKDGRRIACRGWAVPQMAPGPDGRPTCVGTYAGYRDVSAERRAAAIQARLAAALDASPDFVALVAPGGRAAYLNRAARHLTGLAEDADLGPIESALAGALHLADLQPEREHARMEAAGAAARRDGTWTGETVLLGATGQEIPVSLTLVAHPGDEPGDPPLVSAVARDFRDRVRAEAALAASEARFRALSAASPLGVFHAEPDGRLTYANPRVAELWRAAPDALLGFGWRDVVHPDDRGTGLAAWAAANARGAEFAHEFRICVPRRAPHHASPSAARGDDAGAGGAGISGSGTGQDGPDSSGTGGSGISGPAPHIPGGSETRWVRARTAVIPAAGARPASVVGTVEDVTERVRRERAMRRLTEILEASPDLVLGATPDGRLAYANASARALLGMAGAVADAPEARGGAGRTLADVVPALAPGGPAAGAAAHARDHGLWCGEAALRKADGREVPVELVLVAHRNPDGAVGYLSATLRDVTERKQYEATLRALALVDDLTGLYNRRGLLALGEQEWQRAAAAGEGVLAVYVDLDAFKAINDTHGHAAGDRALAEVAGVLRRTFREADVLGRMGGDEFVAVARCGAGQDPGETVARVLARLDAELAAANSAAAAGGARPFALALSAGAAHTAGLGGAAPGAGSLAALLTAADTALYDRKLARTRAPRGPAPRP